MLRTKYVHHYRWVAKHASRHMVLQIFYNLIIALWFVDLPKYFVTVSYMYCVSSLAERKTLDKFSFIWKLFTGMAISLWKLVYEFCWKHLLIVRLVIAFANKPWRGIDESYNFENSAGGYQFETHVFPLPFVVLNYPNLALSMLLIFMYLLPETFRLFFWILPNSFWIIAVISKEENTFLQITIVCLPT